MKKVLQGLFCGLLFCLTLINASAEGFATREQVDTIVARSIRPFLGFSGHRLFIQHSGEDNLVLEYLMFRKASDALFDELKTTPSADVESLIHFTGTNVFHKLCSKEFWLTYKDYVTKAESSKKFDYSIRDARYAELASTFADEYGALMERAQSFAKGNILPHGLYSFDYTTRKGNAHSKLKIDRNRLPILMVKTLQEYFTYDEFKQSKAECCGVLELLSYKFLDAEGYGPEMKEPVDSLLNDESSFDKLANYMNISRGTLYVERGKCRPKVSGLKLRDGVYSGQTLDGIPDGYGELTDKKGALYVGDFRNGLRHGLFLVSKRSESLDTLTGLGYDENQWWFRGKFYKAEDSGSYLDAIMPEVPVLDGERFGRGCLYNQHASKLKKGFFVDGNLVGGGTIYNLPNGPKESGVYRDGLVTGCRIEWNDKGLRYSRFKGVQNGDLRSGERRRVSLKGNEEWIYKGEFLEDELEGKGEYLYIRDKDTTTRTGYFAYGRMYGHGRIVTRRQADKEGKVEERTYEGSVYRNGPYGNGSVEIRFDSVPNNKLVAARYGVKFREYLGDESEVTINIEGYFVRGNLVEGKVTLSNGTYMQGKFADGTLAQGRLVKRYADGSSYDGECRNGRYHGYGKITYADGSSYEGLFENGGEKQYKGVLVKEQPEAMKKVNKTYSFSDLPVEKGVVRVVRAAGVKIMVRGLSSVEVRCLGFFNGDVMYEGRVWVSDGTWLDGTFEDGVLIKGKGKTLDKYGTVYVGDIKNGFPHGQGKCTYTDGTWFKGNFANGNRMDGVHYAADGKVIKVYQK